MAMNDDLEEYQNLALNKESEVEHDGITTTLHSKKGDD